MTMKWLMGALAALAMVGCGGTEGAASSRSAVGDPLARAPDLSVTGVVTTCDAGAELLGLTGPFLQTLVTLRPLEAQPVALEGGNQATFAVQPGGAYFTWTATTPITFIIAYGYGASNLYLYSPPSLGDGTELLGAPQAADGALVDFAKVCYVLPASGGCTLTQGYWKTHSANGPAPYDDTWAQIGEGTTFFLSGKTYYEVMWTEPRGNAYYQLAHQYIAAKLNGLAGASLGDLQDEFDAATALFQTKTPADALTMKSTFNALAGQLGAYNEGEVGPGHCEE